MKIPFRAALTALCMAIMFSCAKSEEIDSNAREQEALDAWIATLGDPTIIPHDSGIWTKMIYTSPQGGAAVMPNEWAEISYTGYMLPTAPIDGAKGSIFVTRDSLTAAIQGVTGTWNTHYAPQKVLVSTKPKEITKAMYEALLMLHEGDTIRVYAPSRLMFGTNASTYSYGYQGQVVVPANKPCYFEMTLVRAIPDVSKDEDDQVAAFALNDMGWAFPDEHLFKEDYYLQRLPNNIAADSIGNDSIVNLWYVARLLDGFVYGTNIDSIALRVWNDTTTHSTYTTRPSTGDLIKGFTQALPTMTYDSWGRVVCSSAYGYGYNGLYPQGANTSPADYGTQIDPYTPLHLEFYVESNKPNTDDDDD